MSGVFLCNNMQKMLPEAEAEGVQQIEGVRRDAGCSDVQTELSVFVHTDLVLYHQAMPVTWVGVEH
jgi:hypothetical protein